MVSEENNKVTAKVTSVSRGLAAVSLVREIATLMILSLGIGFFVGMIIDRWLNTGPLFIILGSFIGTASGFRLIYRLIMRLVKRGDNR